MEKMKQKALELLQQCDIVIIASIDDKGCPRPVPMSKIKADGNSIWLSTGTSSEKTTDFLVNPKAGICFYKEDDMVGMTGRVEVVKDMNMKKELWQDWFFKHFPKGVNDPEYCILKFTGEYVTYWIDNEFRKEKLAS